MFRGDRDRALAMARGILAIYLPVVKLKTLPPQAEIPYMGIPQIKINPRLHSKPCWPSNHGCEQKRMELFKEFGSRIYLALVYQKIDQTELHGFVVQ